MTEFFKWFHVDGYTVVARGERVGEVVGVAREPPLGRAILVDVDVDVDVDVEVEAGARRIALPFDEVAGVDGHGETVSVLAAAESVRTAPSYDPAREAPDEAYLARVREHLRR